MTGDALLEHLLVLHGIHPDPVERRVAHALDELRPAVGGPQRSSHSMP